MMQMLAPQSPAQNTEWCQQHGCNWLTIGTNPAAVARGSQLRCYETEDVGEAAAAGSGDGFRGSQSVSYRRVKVKGLFWYKMMIKHELALEEDSNS